MSQGDEPLKDFDARLRRARGEAGPVADGPEGGGEKPMTGLAMGLRIGTELVAALVVGVGIGYLLDRWLGTTPWLMVVFFFLGSAAGMLNVYRAAASIGHAPLPPSARTRADEDGGIED